MVAAQSVTPSSPMSGESKGPNSWQSKLGSDLAAPKNALCPETVRLNLCEPRSLRPPTLRATAG